MFLPLKKIIKKRLKEYSFRDNILALEVCQLWEDVVKEFINKKSSKKTKALFFNKKVLYIKVQNSVLSQELQLKKEKIIEELNKILKKKEVKDIIFRI